MAAASALLLLFAIHPAHAAMGRARQAPTPIVTPGGTVLQGMVDGSAMDYLRMSMNGLFEYGFAPAREMSPPPSTQYPRPAEVVAQYFLANNKSALGIFQDVADFQQVSTQVQCDGSELVTFQQTWNYTPVDTSFIRMTVSDQVVRYLEARFIPEVSALPVCQAAPPTGVAIGMRYQPTGTNTIVVVITIDQLCRCDVETSWDACSNQIVGSTTRYK